MAIFIVLIWLHFFADFICQTDKMALNKSTSNQWLAYHCCAYMAPFFVCFGWKFGIATFVLHFMTDWVTSRGTSYLWKRNERHWFFCLIGFDQAIHLTTLLLTYNFLVAKLSV